MQLALFFIENIIFWWISYFFWKESGFEICTLFDFFQAVSHSNLLFFLMKLSIIIIKFLFHSFHSKIFSQVLSSTPTAMQCPLQFLTHFLNCSSNENIKNFSLQLLISKNCECRRDRSENKADVKQNVKKDKIWKWEFHFHFVTIWLFHLDLIQSGNNWRKLSRLQNETFYAKQLFSWKQV